MSLPRRENSYSHHVKGILITQYMYKGNFGSELAQNSQNRQKAHCGKTEKNDRRKYLFSLLKESDDQRQINGET